MEQIRNEEHRGEHPLFATHDFQLEDAAIRVGESALRECSNIIAINCCLEGKYPFWHTDRFIMKNCLFTEGARVALWYSQSLQMAGTLVEAPKMFREMDGIKLEDVRLPNALETFWYCRNVELKNVQIDRAGYLFMHSENIKIQSYTQNGSYSFQYCKNVEIHNVVIDFKDAFQSTENVTVYDSELSGEYLRQYSKNLRLVNCRISGTQPLYYAHDLVIEDCAVAEDANLTFKHSGAKTTIKSPVHSVKNPRTGSIVAESFGTIILDGNIKSPANCELRLWDDLTCFN